MLLTCCRLATLSCHTLLFTCSCCVCFVTLLVYVRQMFHNFKYSFFVFFLSAFVGVTGLIEKLAADRCLPAFFLHRNRFFNTHHWVILGFFFTTSSLYLIVGGNVTSLGGVFAVAFLSVMCMFAFGNLCLKFKRPRLPRPVVVMWGTVLIGFSCMLSGLIGNLVVDPSILKYFALYFSIPMVVITFTFNRIRLTRIILLFCCQMAKLISLLFLLLCYVVLFLGPFLLTIPYDWLVLICFISFYLAVSFFFFYCVCCFNTIQWQHFFCVSSDLCHVTLATTYQTLLVASLSVSSIVAREAQSTRRQFCDTRVTKKEREGSTEVHKKTRLSWGVIYHTMQNYIQPRPF